MNPSHSRRGSVLVVAMIFAVIIAISLASYLELSVTSYRLSQRSFYANAAMDLVDMGLEQGMWSLNQADWTGGGFAARGSTYPNQWQGTFPTGATGYYSYPGNVKGQVKVWVDNSVANPHIVAKATIFFNNGATLVKEAEIYSKRDSYFNNGLVAKNSITFSGNNAQVDSWNSNPANTSGTYIPYSSSVATDSGKVGSTSVQVDSISVSNANIYGYAAIGSSSLSGISVGPNGLVGPYGTPNGTIDTTHVTYDFTTSFPDATAPTTSGYTIAAISGATSLPRAGDTPAADGKYYYSVPSISLSGNGSTLNIGGAAASNVVLVVTGSTGSSVSVSGKGGIDIAKGSTLAMYTAGDVSIGGNGIINGSYDPSETLSATNAPNQPSAFQVYGTRSAGDVTSNGEQNISIAGNGVLSGVVYAPNANISLTGGGNNGQVLGAMVGNNVTVTGNSVFHYDESLANLNSSNLWTVSKWREVASATNRATFAPELNF